MTRVTRLVLFFAVLSGGVAPMPARAQASGPDPLRVVSVGPEGEVASLAEANEIRVVFSEPMVTLGRIPARVTAPFFRIQPALPGTFRWSGTTTLIFTPASERPLPYATRYEVTIDPSATAVSGRRLARAHRFSFTTPTVRLLQTTWYRRGGRAGAQMVVLLRFNQPVRAADVAAHVTARFQPHVWEDEPQLPAGSVERLKTNDPAAVQRFSARVAATRAAVAASGPVGLQLAAEWDRKRFPPAPDLVAFETTTDVPPEAWVRLRVAPTVPSPAGPEKPREPGEYTIEVEPAFFVRQFHCTTACPADDRNWVEFRGPVKAAAFASAVHAVDVTDPGRPAPVSRSPAPRNRRAYQMDESESFSLEDAGFERQPPARTWSITIDPSLRSADGQTLGYTWTGTVENWHERAFTSFGDGHGVWERTGDARLPFYARNFLDVTEWTHRVRVPDLMPTILQLQRDGPDDRGGRPFAEPPPSPGRPRRLPVTPDRIQSHGLDLSGALDANGAGLVWAATRGNLAIDRAPRARHMDDGVRASVVQVTNLGITVKDSPLNTLVFVTRLDSGAPVGGARVSIVDRANTQHWTGTTSGDGVAVAPHTPGLRDPEQWWRLSFIVTAEKDGDVAYAGSDWNEGILPWNFGLGFDLAQAGPMLRGTVFSDRGVYRPGEAVQFKAVLRHNAPDGIRLLPAGTPVLVTMQDNQGRVVDERTVRTNEWSSAEWSTPLPAGGSLGTYSVRAILEGDRPSPRKPEDLRPGDDPGPELDDFVPYEKAVRGSFLVAAYRRPDFRVDATLTGGAVKAGESVKGRVSARYLFGAAMPARPVSWTWTRTPGYGVPPAVRDALRDGDQWIFVGAVERSRDETPVLSREARTSRQGDLALELPTASDAGIPYVYTLEADVEDVSRQHIASRASVTVHPADWYVGIKRPAYLVSQEAGLETALVAVTPSGQVTGGVPIEITLTQVQWTSVRRAEGNGFYTWETERKEVPAGRWTVATADEPVPLQAPLENGGYYELEAVARDASGRAAVTRTSFYAMGRGYTAWQRHDHNRIALVADKPRYRPGETAQIMVQSPWEEATALVTTEREGVRSHRQFALTSTQQSLSIPVTEADIPNLFVSVLLVRGRTSTPAPSSTAGPSGGPSFVDDPSDPGKPAFRLGYVELQVEDASKRLTVTVAANQQEYRPAHDADVRLEVFDHRGIPAESEVTLWAVDHGVLSLTGYRTPDLLGSVYVHKALQVMTSDSRQRIVSRRVLTPKGEGEGGGGGLEAAGVRRDFMALAFWLGSVTTDGSGRATVTVKLPESLTTYRIMAVAGDKASRFGSGEAEVRVNKPLTLRPAFPRFLAAGDKAQFGAAVTSQLAAGGAATVSIQSLDPHLLHVNGEASQTVALAPGESVEVRFEAAARAIGRARVRMSVQLEDETDAFEDVIPIEVLAPPETVAAYGQTAAEAGAAAERLTVPLGVLPGFGGLRVELSSTALVGLGEGARYLVEYPYGCAEQKGSRALALLLASDLGDAFGLPGLETSKMRPAAQQALDDLRRFQCADGGFTYWPGACDARSAYLTSYLLHVFRNASDLQLRVDAGMRGRAYDYLARELATTPPLNEGWWPAYTAWQAFAVKVLVEGGRTQDSHLTRLYGYRDRMPVFALAFLHDALLAAGESSGARVDDLRRRMANAILPEGASAHVEELSDPHLLWFWNSNIRSTAIVLRSLVRASAGVEEIRPLVRWLMAVRKGGRWGNTQENAYAMEALVAYYRQYEGTVPAFTAVASLGARELVRREFTGRSTASSIAELPMTGVLAAAPAGTTQALTFAREGRGTLFYASRLRYAVDDTFHDGLDAGIRIERAYEPYVETGSRPASTSYRAGDLVRVTLTLDLTKERRYVAVTDPVPAGFEPLESWFATTARAIRAGGRDGGDDVESAWEERWARGGFDHVERHDDRVLLFGTRLAEGRHRFTYLVRATTAGTFRTAPARAEEMYEPEIFGRTRTVTITVRP